MLKIFLNMHLILKKWVGVFFIMIMFVAAATTTVLEDVSMKKESTGFSEANWNGAF